MIPGHKNNAPPKQSVIFYLPAFLNKDTPFITTEATVHTHSAFDIAGVTSTNALQFSFITHPALAL